MLGITGTATAVLLCSTASGPGAPTPRGQPASVPAAHARDRAESASKPNILVILTDDHGYADLSCMGSRSDVATPNIDSLAESGVRMTSGYVTAPQCRPSRCALITGRYQYRFGLASNSEEDLPVGEPTLATRLQEGGYVTGMAGKWHVGPLSAMHGHGFEEVFRSSGRWTAIDGDGEKRAWHRDVAGMYHVDAISAAAVEFIDRHHEEPFFFYLSYRAPHVPLDATEQYLGRFPGEMPERRRQALAMISAVDDGVGRVLETLRAHELEESTLIFFLSDHGAPLNLHKLDTPGGGIGWNGSLNEPMNGEKGMLSEGGIRVPFLVRWKGVLPEAVIYAHPVSSLDVAATAVSGAGLEPDPLLDGVDLVPWLKGAREGAPHQRLFWNWGGQAAVREGRWKLLVGGDRRYLFDLESDSGETTNRIASHPEIAKRLEEELTTWANEQGIEAVGGPLDSKETRRFDFHLDRRDVPPHVGDFDKAPSP